MAFLSKISLNPLRRETQRLVANPHAIHAAVLGSIPPPHAGERSLWRIEPQDHSVNLVALTQSRPSWVNLVDRYGWPLADGGDALVRDLEPILRLVTAGREFGFRVCANPARRVRQPEHPTPAQQRACAVDGRRRGIRVGERTAGHQLDWFLARAAGDAAAWGFTVGSPAGPHVRVVGRRRLRFVKGRGGPVVTLDTATYEGRLRVTDAAQLQRVLVGGLGGGKAFGCGLLTLAPVTPHVVAD